MPISILGCGWLGLPLAQQLLKNKIDVKGSTTTHSKLPILKQVGIEPYLLSLPGDINKPENESFWNSEILFLNIPPRRPSEDVYKTYTEKIKAVKNKILDSNINWVIFVSSTSVYSQDGGLVKEEDATKQDSSRLSGEALLETEELLMAENSFQTTILRFGGLYGYDRHPIHYLAGRTGVKNPSQPVNLIHQDDCIKIVTEIIRQNRRNEIYNAVSHGHPPKRTFYRAAAKHFDLVPPEFEKNSSSKNRVISNEKLVKDLEYEFIYPNPMDFTP